MVTGALGELSVDLAQYGWFPSVLPSEEGDDAALLGDEEPVTDDNEEGES